MLLLLFQDQQQRQPREQEEVGGEQGHRHHGRPGVCVSIVCSST